VTWCPILALPPSSKIPNLFRWSCNTLGVLWIFKEFEGFINRIPSHKFPRFTGILEDLFRQDPKSF